MAGRMPICLVLVLLAVCGGADAWQQHPTRRHNVAQPRLHRPMPAFRSVAHRRPLLRQPLDSTASSQNTQPPPAPVTLSPTVQKYDYAQHPVPCSDHSDCHGGEGYCRQAVGGPRCSPCIDYRMHSCDDWGDSITGNCDVCHVRDTKVDPNRPSEQQRDATQEVYEEEAVIEAIAAPIYGRYGELRSEPSPPTQSGAGRKDFIRQQQYHHSNGNSNGVHVAAPHECSDENVLAKLKAPANRDMQTESSPSDQVLSSEPEPAVPGRRLPAQPLWFTSSISQQHWPSDGSGPPISSTVDRTLEPDHVSGATVDRQVLHRAAGDKEVHDTLIARHEQDEDKGRDSDPAAAVAYANGKKTAASGRQVKNIETEDELAVFERQLSDSSTGQRQQHQPYYAQNEEPQPQQQPLFSRCQRHHHQRMCEVQNQLLRGSESNDALLRLLGQVFRSPVSADGEYDGTNDAMAILRGVAAGL